MLEILTFSLLNGVVYGLLLFMLSSGLTLIFSLMGVLNFAHASLFMLGAYFSWQLSRWIGFVPALVLAPLLCGLIGAAIERYGLRAVHRQGHVAAILGPIVFVVVVVGGLGSIPGAFYASMLIGIVQTFAVALDYSMLDLLGAFGVTLTRADRFYEVAAIKIAQAAPILPYVLLVVMLVVR